MKNLTTLAFVAIATLANAQKSEPMTPDQIAKHQTEMVTSSLKLSDEEAAKLNEVMLEAAMNTEELRQQCREIDKRIKEVYDERMGSFVSNLGKEQQDAYMEAQKEGKIEFSACGMGSCASGTKQASGCSSSKPASSGKSCCASGASHGETKAAESTKEAPAKK